MKINKQKIKEYIELPLLAILIFVVMFILLDGDAFKSIFVASFVFIFTVTKKEKIFTDIEGGEESNSFFRNSIIGGAFHSLFILFGAAVLTSFLFWVFVDYCSDSNLFRSQERCAIEKATQNISEQYGSTYDAYRDY